MGKDWKMNEISPQEAKQIAEEAYVFAFSMLEPTFRTYMSTK
jgi:hypothetical protein